MLLDDKNAITGTLVNVTSGTFPSYTTPASRELSVKGRQRDD